MTIRAEHLAGIARRPGRGPVEVWRPPAGGSLWIGGEPHVGEAVARAGFDVLVLCADENQEEADAFPGVRRVIYAPLADVPNTMEAHEPSIAADAAIAVVGELRRGANVLVTCAGGRNRSGLVCAMVLRLLTGMSGNAIIAHLRARREGAVANAAYAAHVVGLP